MPNIRAISCVVPRQKIKNKNFYEKFDESHIKSVQNIVGVKNRFWAQEETSLSLCCEASENLFDELSLKNIELRSKVELLLFITQTPDNLMPSIAYEAHSVLKLNNNCVCYSLNAGCTGFVDGLGLAYDLITSRGFNNCLFLIGDTLSKHLDNTDPGTAPIFGDAGAAIWIDNQHGTNSIVMGGTKPNTTKSIQLKYKTNKKSEFLSMNGLDVFNFTINGIPKFVESVTSKWMDLYNYKLDIDYYFFHQANNMILNSIIKKLQLDRSKVPLNIDQYGNTSGVTIPLLINSIYNENLKCKSFSAMLCGFGVGLSWSAMLVDSIKLEFSRTVIKD